MDITGLAERYQGVHTGVVSDALDELGHRYRALPCDLFSLRPGDRVAGPAFTVRGRPSDETDTSRRIGPHALEKAAPGSVVCYDAGGDVRAGIWGELWTAASVAKGLRGAIVDGAIRDAGRIVDYPFPIFYRNRRPTDAIGRFTVVESGGPIELAGISVSPGDMVIADSDGAVIVPQSLTNAVIEIAERRLGDERKMRGMLDTGVDARTVYANFDHF